MGQERERIQQDHLREEAMDALRLRIVSAICLTWRRLPVPSTHILQFCYFSWGENLVVDEDGTVDCTNIVMAHGKSYVKENTKCVVCGLTTGLKTMCSDENCRARGEKKSPNSFHPTCARQAGFEVQYDEERDPQFYGKWRRDCLCFSNRERWAC